MSVSPVIAEYDTGPLTREMLAAYAEASGDRNPLHLDPAFARQAGFEDVIVHGMLGMALLGRLLSEHFAGAPVEAFSARFVGIVPVEQSLKCQARLLEKNGASCTLQLDALDRHGTAVITGTARLGL